ANYIACALLKYSKKSGTVPGVEPKLDKLSFMTIIMIIIIIIIGLRKYTDAFRLLVSEAGSLTAAQTSNLERTGG
ncbi:MAG: hypothetical protein ABIG43_00050, partial [Chloroflexota bacterium]